VVYDVLVRHLRARDMAVTYVRNVTDIDDKIVRRAKELGEKPVELARRFTAIFHEDMAKVGVLPADVEPRVSEHLPEIFKLIGDLLARGAAYRVDGDVYFRVQAFPGYGKLSHRRLDDLAHGASGRIDEDEQRRKEHPADFALWKSDDDPEATWESPWGRGRPGWHIECSAMSTRYLGESFDLHGGGLDLVFPHHENEIAQSEAVSGKPLARLWMHNGFVEVNKEKMGKSLGNFFTAREVFRFVEPEAMRWFVMTVHYRAPLSLDWSLDAAGQVQGFPQIEEAERRVEYLYRTRERLQAIEPARLHAGRPVPAVLRDFAARLGEALDDDLNMPVALALAHEALREVNELCEAAARKAGAGRDAAAAAASVFDVLVRVLGLGADDATAFLARLQERRIARLGLDRAAIDGRVRERAEARRARDFARADAIRAELGALGVEVMDTAQGSRWRVG
jgi:cysteinyl-tRNA synthetase